MTTPQRTIVRANKLMAIEPFQSSEETRYYLYGVHIEPHAEGAILVATDGHTLAAILDRDAHMAGLPATWNHQIKDRVGKRLSAWAKENPERTIWCDMQLRHPNGNPDMLSIVAADNPQQILLGNGQTLLQLPERLLIDGCYPEWRRTVKPPPPEARTKAPNISGSYMKRCVDFFAAMTGERTVPITLHQTDPSGPYRAGPVRVTSPTVQDVFVVVMPMSRDALTEEEYHPYWLELPGDAQTEEVARVA